MTYKEAINLVTFKNYCGCGARSRLREERHALWCEQRKEFDEWESAMNSGPYPIDWRSSASHWHDGKVYIQRFCHKHPTWRIGYEKCSQSMDSSCINCIPIPKPFNFDRGKHVFVVGYCTLPVARADRKDVPYGGVLEVILPENKAGVVLVVVQGVVVSRS